MKSAHLIRIHTHICLNWDLPLSERINNSFNTKAFLRLKGIIWHLLSYLIKIDIWLRLIHQAGVIYSWLTGRPWKLNSWFKIGLIILNECSLSQRVTVHLLWELWDIVTVSYISNTSHEILRECIHLLAVIKLCWFLLPVTIEVLKRVSYKAIL